MASSNGFVAIDLRALDAENQTLWRSFGPKRRGGMPRPPPKKANLLRLQRALDPFVGEYALVYRLTDIVQDVGGLTARWDLYCFAHDSALRDSS